MEKEQEFRNKSAMVVFQLEKDLGDFVKIIGNNKSEEDVNSLANHVSKITDENSSLTIVKLVEKSYLDEIFCLAMELSKGTSNFDRLKKLKDLCSLYGLFLIRNAIAHPNKQFPENYWYKTCCIATDSLIENLNLPNVYSSFRSAEAGRIVLPPEEWMSQTIWCIPNDLPTQFEHSITGFVGRKQDISNILKLIENKRHSLIAITGPGGLGKTAISLEILKDISNDPKYMNDFDAISFISMKTEKLTVEGIKKIPTIDTLEGLKHKITENLNNLFDDNLSYETILTTYDNKRILLFIDNLETLLRDNQEDFCTFINQLPEKWRVIVTSRIAVDSAVSYPLHDMTDIDAMKLARFYAERRNVSSYIGDYSHMISQLSYNPLAIRLCIDSLQFGKDLNTILCNINSEISSYSYKNLLEVLDEKSIAMLEALFLQNHLAREEIAGILECSMDDVANAVQQLRRTSLILIKNNEEGERFYLNDSIRSYLAFSEINMKVRTKILDRFNQNKRFIEDMRGKQREAKISHNNIWYIPANLPSDLQKLIFSAKSNKIKNDLSKVFSLVKEFNSKEDLYGKYIEYWNVRSFLAKKMNDIQTIKLCVEKLQILGKESFCALYACALAYLYSLNDYEKAENQSFELIKNISKYDLNALEIRDLYTTYLKSLIFQKKNQEVLDFTTKWKSEKNLRCTLGTARAYAYKRKYEDTYPYNEKIDYLSKAVKILQDVYEVDGADKFSITVLKELHKAILELFEDENVKDIKIAQLFVSFIFNTMDSLYTKGIDEKSLRILANVKCIENPFQLNEDFSTFDIDDILINPDYVKVSVYHIPDSTKSFPLYIFAEDADKQQYYLRLDCCRNLDLFGWKNIKIGSFFYVKPIKKELTAGRAIETTDIYIYKY
ncbi:MAG: NB-ARC domain-containing protein [Alphaproteobacteria bacterium]